jgi:purine-nucleoside phosphorylase
MSVIMDFQAERIGKVFFGSSPSDIKGTVVMTLGIPWFFRRLNKQKCVVKRNAGWWNLSVMQCDGAEVTLLSVGSGSAEVTDVIRLLTKFRCKNVVSVGLAGALRREIQIGDILVPTRCIRPPFASGARKGVGYSQELYSAYKGEMEGFCVKNKVSLQYGTLCTVDSVTCENSEFFSYAKSLGLSAVDMETFYLHKEAANAGLRVSSFHVISDNPIAHKSFLDDIPENDVKRKRRVYGKLPSLLKAVASVIEKEL